MIYPLNFHILYHIPITPQNVPCYLFCQLSSPNQMRSISHQKVLPKKRVNRLIVIPCGKSYYFFSLKKPTNLLFLSAHAVKLLNNFTLTQLHLLLREKNLFGIVKRRKPSSVSKKTLAYSSTRLSYKRPAKSSLSALR